MNFKMIIMFDPVQTGGLIDVPYWRERFIREPFQRPGRTVLLILKFCSSWYSNVVATLEDKCNLLRMIELLQRYCHVMTKSLWLENPILKIYSSWCNLVVATLEDKCNLLRMIELLQRNCYVMTKSLWLRGIIHLYGNLIPFFMLLRIELVDFSYLFSLLGLKPTVT